MILAQIREYAGRKPLILTIEPVEKDAPIVNKEASGCPFMIAMDTN